MTICLPQHPSAGKEWRAPPHTQLPTTQSPSGLLMSTGRGWGEVGGGPDPLAGIPLPRSVKVKVRDSGGPSARARKCVCGGVNSRCLPGAGDALPLLDVLFVIIFPFRLFFYLR